MNSLEIGQVMTKAVVTGSLTDIRNIGTDKSVKLTVHVPVELAMQVIDAFGWPSSVDPVPVAVARIVETEDGRDMGSD
jgi:hypothetical protein